jgi:hypothetical protein
LRVLVWAWGRESVLDYFLILRSGVVRIVSFGFLRVALSVISVSSEILGVILHAVIIFEIHVIVVLLKLV